MKLTVFGTLFLMFSLLACEKKETMPPKEAALVQGTVQVEPLPCPPRGKAVSWLVHRGGWGDSPGYGTRLDTGHYDGFLEDYSSGLEAEIREVAKLKNAAIIQDFGDIGKLASAVQESGTRYAVVNTLSPLVLKQFQIKTPQDCAAYLINLLSIRKKYPGYYEIDGRPVAFTFDVTGFSAEEWKTILRLTREAYPGEKFQFVAQCSVFVVLNKPDPLAFMKELLGVFDGIMFWGGPQDAKWKNLELARRAIREIGCDKLVFWVLTNGYWRPEKGMFLDPRGIRTWLDQLKICFENEFDGVIVESWNDLEENTHVLPSQENGGVFFELLRYYSAISNGCDYAAVAPGLLLVHPRDIMPGETLDVQVVALPVGASRSTFRLELDDEQGRAVYRSPEQSAPPGAADLFEFSIPTRPLAEAGRLNCRLVVDGKTFQTGSFVTIQMSRVESPWFQGVVVGHVIQPDAVHFELHPKGAELEANIQIHHDTPLSRVDIWSGNRPVWSLDGERLNRQRTWEHHPVGIEFDFQMPQNYAGESNDRSGFLTVENGVLVRGFDKLGKSLVISPGRGEWTAPPSLGRQFNMKWLVDADDNTCFTVNLGKLGQKVRFTLGELRRSGILEHKTSEHGRVWVRETDNPVVFQVEQGALGMEVKEKLVLHPVGERMKNEYSLRMLDANGRIFRSAPVTVFSQERKGGEKQWFWDESTGERFAAPVSMDEQTEMGWAFDGPPERVYGDESGSGTLARLGGGMFRAGHFSPAAIPVLMDRDQGHAPHFDGNDYIQIDAGAFPQGAFEMRLDVCPEKFAPGGQALFFSRSNLSLFLTEDGRVGVRFQGLADMSQPQELLSAEKLPLNRWTRIRVSYDYRELTLDVGGSCVSVPLAKGPVRNVSAESYLGAEVSGAEGSTARRFFVGGLDNLKIRCGAPAGEVLPETGK